METQRRQYIFYDLETTGLDPARDCIIQAAFMVVDEDLNDIDAATIHCRPRLDSIPSPGAYLTHFIAPGLVNEQGRSEMTLAGSIRQALLSSSTRDAMPSTIIGYNNMSFDNEFLRHLFWRNLHDPYEHEWQGGNRTADAFHLVALASAFCPTALDAWPKKESGEPDMKLTALAEANGIEVEKAHDAASDVSTTLGIVRTIAERNPSMFRYWHQLSDKRAAQEILTSRSPFWHVHPAKKDRPHGATLACPVAVSLRNAQSYICVDLRQDPDELLAMTPDEIASRLMRKGADMGPSERRPGCFTVQANKQPMLIKAPQEPKQHLLHRHEIDYEQSLERMHRAQRNPKLGKLLQQALDPSKRLPRRKDYAGGGLYDGGFLTDHDRRLRRELRSLTSEKDAAGLRIPKLLRTKLSDMSDEFEDLPRNAELYIRAKYHEGFDELLDAAEGGKAHPALCPYEFYAYYEHLRDCLASDDNGDERKYSIADYKAESHEARITHLDDDARSMLDALDEHVKDKVEKCNRMGVAAEKIRPLAELMAADETTLIGRLHRARETERDKVDAERATVLKKNAKQQNEKKPKRQGRRCAAGAP